MSDRVDERDTLFARMERTEGTRAYADYYGARRPELRAIDDRLRALPPLLDERGWHYEAGYARATAETFDAIERIEVDEAEVEDLSRRFDRAASPTIGVKELLLGLGAVSAGCTGLDPRTIYTHKGRFDDDYGRAIDLSHDHAAVFLVEMDLERMRAAPKAPTLLESARQYYRAARIAKIAAAVLRARGHDAKPHYDANYDVILPPLAVAAGLGELGRNNILVADRYGSRVRIGAVTTSLALEEDAPVSLGVEAFCRVCGKCAENCPSRALTTGPKQMVRGVAKWPTNVERCYGWWRHIGTDCGICMAVCPFSHANNWFHNTIHRLVRTAPALNRTALFFDDWVYGHRWNRGTVPE